MAGWNPKANEIFLSACPILAPEERQAFLTRACGDDAELRANVDKLLLAHDQAATFLEEPLARNAPSPGDTAWQTSSPAQATPTRPREQIGPYTLLEPLGEEGMGVVWLAEQKEPLQRRVALKIIKPGLSSTQVLARFEQERQALAVMEHENIAKVLDAGTTSEGRPFFVMELIKGVPITRYCDDGSVPLRERLAMFVQICDAVQHAHQKGIIHRDLKPSNVLVSLPEGRPVVKVIDFGVAKAIEQKFTDRTLETEFGSLIGTLEYMAPEQAKLNNTDVDTRADIYSLGVMLYELLVGTPPFSVKEMQSAAFTEMLRVIREVDPPRPSTRIMASATLPSVAARRRVEPTRLTNSLKGDLDWIVMKCLEKDRDRRYDSASALGDDLRRYLSDEPVAAGPPSASYRFQKFIRRNRRLVMAGAAIALILAIGFAGTAWGLVRARKAESLAFTRLKQVETAEKQTRQALADSEAARQLEQATADFMINAFERADPGADGKDLTVLSVLDSTARDLETQFVGSPLLKARLENQLGLSYNALGVYDRALTFFRQAHASQRKLLGEDHRDTLYSLMNQANCLTRLGKEAEAVPLFEQVRNRFLAQHGAEHADTLAATYNLCVTYFDVERQEEGVALGEQTLATLQKTLGDDDRRTINAMSGLSVMLRRRDSKRSLALAQEANERALRTLGPLHSTTVLNRQALANSLAAENRAPEAIDLLKQHAEQLDAGYGVEHPVTINTLLSLAFAYRDAGRTAEAIAPAERAFQAALVRYGSEARYTQRARHSLGYLYRGLGENEKALPHLEASLAYSEQRLDADQVDSHRIELVVCYEHLRQWDKSLPLLVRCAAERTERLGATHPETRLVQERLARSLLRLQRFAETEALLTPFLSALKADAKVAELDRAQTIFLLASAQARQGRLEAAESTIQEWQSLAGANEDDYESHALRAFQGARFLETNLLTSAENRLLAALPGMQRTAGNRLAEDRWPEQFCLEHLVELYEIKQDEPQREFWRKRLQEAK